MPTTSEYDLGEAVPLDIRLAVAHSHATITLNDAASISTAPELWSYAAGFHFERTLLPDAVKVLIRVEATITRGRIGIIFVNEALDEAIGNDHERSSADGFTKVDLLVDAPPDSGWVIIRNNSRDGTEAHCEIHSVVVYSAMPRLEEPSSLDAIPKEPCGNCLLESDQPGLAEQPEAVIWETLRQKWSEVPAGLMGRRRTTDLLRLDDIQLTNLWTEAHGDATRGSGYPARGWYQDLYADILRGKKVLDVGSGLGLDGITFLKAGARVTFLDIAASNLELLRKLCGIFEVEAGGFFYVQDLSSLDSLPDDFDVIWCQGSMINAPFEFSHRESLGLLKHLRVGGRWIELAYPRERWVREGKVPFSEWGKLTDGAATPWMEWYDLQRLLQRLAPAEFDVLLSFNFHNDDFNWFDLIRRK